MKIDGYAPLAESFLSKQEGPASSSGTNTPATGSSNIQDETNLSVDSQKIGLLQSQITQLPEVRQDRVAALRSAVQEGRYQVSDEQIANAILNEG